MQAEVKMSTRRNDPRRAAMLAGVAAMLQLVSVLPLRAQNTDSRRPGRRHAAVSAKGQLPGLPWLGGATAARWDGQMPDGANLRESVPRPRDADPSHQVRAAGKPRCPAFDKFAYSDGRCYGLKQADLKSPTRQMPDPGRRPCRRVRSKTIADFMLARIVGKGPMDRAKCIDYWGSDVEACGGVSEVAERL